MTAKQMLLKQLFVYVPSWMCELNGLTSPILVAIQHVDTKESTEVTSVIARRNSLSFIWPSVVREQEAHI